MHPLEPQVSALGRFRYLYSPGDFFSLSLINHVRKRLPKFAAPQTLYLVTNGLANLATPSPNLDALVTEIVTLASSNLPEYKPQELSSFLASLGKLRTRPSPVFLVLARDLVLAQMHRYKPVDLSKIVLGFVKMSFSPGEDFLDALRYRCLSALGSSGPINAEDEPEADPGDLAHLLMAFVRLGCSPGEDVMARMAAIFERRAQVRWMLIIDSFFRYTALVDSGLQPQVKLTP